MIIKIPGFFELDKEDNELNIFINKYERNQILYGDIFQNLSILNKVRSSNISHTFGLK
jgi:hypothetical protein